ncbi:MAG: hypothetical protein ABIM44_01210 [candidate division WOR-3 bacterium]
MKPQKYLQLFIYFVFVTSISAEKYRGEVFRLFYPPALVSMGNTGVAYTPEPLSSTINPSIISKTKTVYFYHGELYSGLIGLESFFFSTPNIFENLNTAISVNFIHSDRLEVTEIRDSLSTEGAVNVIARKPYLFYNLNIISARPINERSNFGFSLKVFREQFHDYVENGLGVDLGYVFQNRRLTYGFVLRDAFYSIFKGNSIEKVAPSLLIGATLNDEKLAWSIELEIFTDGPYPGALYTYKNFSIEGKTGFAYILTENLGLRLGFYRGYLNAGINLKYKRFRLDYAISPHPDLNVTHRVGAGICL